MTRFQSVFNLSMFAALLSLVAGVQMGMAQGTVSAWGSNAYGELGNGMYTDSNVPMAGTGLIGVAALSAGESYSLALKSDGTVWAWGLNDHGQLGNGTYTDSTTPVQAIGLTGVVMVAVAAGAHHNWR